MASIHIIGKTSVSPEQFIASLKDFGPNRGSVWANSQSQYLVLHDQGPSWAEVTEGSNFFGGVWERLHYDWSKPGTIILRTLDSNVWSDKSSWRYKLTEAPDGSGTIIKYTITRFALNKKAYAILIMMSLVGKRVLTKNFHKTLRAIESIAKAS